MLVWVITGLLVNKVLPRSSRHCHVYSVHCALTCRLRSTTKNYQVENDTNLNMVAMVTTTCGGAILVCGVMYYNYTPT